MRAAFSVAACLGPILLAGCGLREEPYTYNDQKEMSGRPGLFTGRPGAIVLFRDTGPPLLDHD